MILLTSLALAAAVGSSELSRTDTDAAFRAAGFEWRSRGWRSDCEDLGNPSYQSGRLRRVADLNGDGRPEALIQEGSAMCFGNTSTRFSLVSKQVDGGWRLMIRNLGVPHFLATRGVDGWPDIEIEGPGMCTPVWRWNGHSYALHRLSRAEAPHCTVRDEP